MVEHSSQNPHKQGKSYHQFLISTQNGVECKTKFKLVSIVTLTGVILVRLSLALFSQVKKTLTPCNSS